MADAKIGIDLDPEKVVAALKEMSEQSEELARQIEQSLGKDAPKNIKKFEEAAENGTTKVSNFFSNLGKRIKEDLARAFDVASIQQGLKFTDELMKGTRQVFDMERAFDRLNVRLGMTRDQFMRFRAEMGKRIAGTGADIEKVLPGVEQFVSRGNLKNPEQLADVSELMGKVAQATGEGTEGLAESIVEILQTSGQQVNAQNIRQTVDAVMATRNSGAFRTAAEAAGAVEGISPYAKRLGISTREAGALAAQASTSGSSGQQILQDFLRMASDKNVDRKKLEGIFGVELFKGGKFDASAIGKIDLNRFKGLSPEKFAQLGFGGGASGGDFARFVESFKGSQERFQKVVAGSNETNAAFETATDNLASKFDKFKRSLQNATSTIGQGLSEAATGLMTGDTARLKGGLGTAGKAASENSGTIAAGLGITLASGLLMGRGAGKLLGGMGGTAAGVAKGKAFEAAGVTPVYVVNASEIGGGMGGMLGQGAAGMLGKFSGMGRFGMYGLAAGAGVAAAEGVNAIPGVQEAMQSAIGKAFDMLGIGPEATAKKYEQEQQAFRAEKLAKQEGIGPEVAMAIVRGMREAKVEVKSTAPITNPSAITNRGGTR